MPKVHSIYEAKTNLSKLIKRASKGETIYVGAYGKPEAIITFPPQRKQVNIGVWDRKFIASAYDYDDLVSPDPEMINWLEADDQMTGVAGE